MLLENGKLCHRDRAWRNQAIFDGGKWVWIDNFTKKKQFRSLRISELHHKSQNKPFINRPLHQTKKTPESDLEVRVQVNGYGDLCVGIYKSVMYSHRVLAFVIYQIYYANHKLIHLSKSRKRNRKKGLWSKKSAL